MLNWHSFLFKKSQKQQQQKKLTKIKHNETIKKEINLKKLILTLPRTQNYPKWLEVDHAHVIFLTTPFLVLIVLLIFPAKQSTFMYLILYLLHRRSKKTFGFY